MRKVIIFIISSVFLSCVQSQTVTVKVTVENKVIKEIILSADTNELVLNAGYWTKVTKIEGIEKLHELKKLRIALGGYYSDYSFLGNLKKLETLILLPARIDDLDFIKDLKNIEVLVLKDALIYKNDFDFSNNKKLKYLDIENIGYKEKNSAGPPFTPNINIPPSVKYLNLYRSNGIIMSKELLSKLAKVPNVIIGDSNFINYLEKIKGKEEVRRSYIENADFIKAHSNFIDKDPKKVLPEEYLDETLINKHLEDDIWQKMKEVQ